MNHLIDEQVAYVKERAEEPVSPRVLRAATVPGEADPPRCPDAIVNVEARGPASAGSSLASNDDQIHGSPSRRGENNRNARDGRKARYIGCLEKDRSAS